MTYLLLEILILILFLILIELQSIYKALRPRLSATLRIFVKGKHMTNLRVGQSFHAVYQEFSGPNGTGTPLPPAGPVKYSSSDPSVATVDPDTGAGVAIAPGSAVITGTDAADSLSASDGLTAQDTAQSATLVVVGE